MGNLTCSPCPKGYECGTGTAEPEACHLGQFATGGAQRCIDCPAGFACPNTTDDYMIPCGPGWYSLSQQASCSPCPAGRQVY